MALPQRTIDDVAATLHVHDHYPAAVRHLETLNDVRRQSGLKPVAPGSAEGRAFINDYADQLTAQWKRRAVACAQPPGQPAAVDPLAQAAVDQHVQKQTAAAAEAAAAKQRLAKARSTILSALEKGGVSRDEAPLRDTLSQLVQEAALPPEVRDEYAILKQELVFGIRRAIEAGAGDSRPRWEKVVKSVFSEFERSNAAYRGLKDWGKETAAVLDLALVGAKSAPSDRAQPDQPSGIPPALPVGFSHTYPLGPSRPTPGPSGIALALSLVADCGPSTRPPRTLGGQPVKRFMKPIARVGAFSAGEASQRIEFTPKVLDGFVASFQRMRAAGVKVPVPVGHTSDPEANRGWLVDLQRSGEFLVGTIDLVGEDAIKLAGTCDVSIYSPPEWTDGRGNQYTWPITHVALTTYPVVPGLGAFIEV